MNKEFTIRDITGIVSYIDHLDQEQIDLLPKDIYKNVNNNINKFKPIVDQFNEFKEKLITNVRNEWFKSDKSEDCEMVTTDEDKNLMSNSASNENTKIIRRIKKEYIDEFNCAINEIKIELNNMMDRTVIIDIDPINISKLLDDNIDFEFANVLASFHLNKE